jgi:hypothetical protein
MFLEEQPTVPWHALQYVIGQINYGGRVTDDNDRHLLMCTLRSFVNPDVLSDNFNFTSCGMCLIASHFFNTINVGGYFQFKITASPNARWHLISNRMQDRLRKHNFSNSE